jgi:hypothetical protein
MDKGLQEAQAMKLSARNKLTAKADIEGSAK